MNSEVIDENDCCWDDGDGVNKNKLHNEIKRAYKDENDTLSESLTNLENVNTIPIGSVETNCTHNYNEDEILHDIRDSKVMNPKTERTDEHREDNKKVPSLNHKRKLKHNDDSEDEKREIIDT